MLWLKQSTAVTLTIGPFVSSSDGFTAQTGLALVQASIRLSKNGAAYAQKGDTTAPAHQENGNYSCVLNTTDTGTLGVLRLHVNFTGALPVWLDMMVVPANVWDSLFGASVLNVNVNTIAANAITASAIQADAITAAKIADGAIDANTFAASAITATAIAANAITAAKVASGTITNATFAASAIDATAIAANAITDAKVASDVTIASVTGSVGSVTGAVGSVTAAVAVASLAANSITAAALAADAGAELADAVWDEPTAGHTTAGTTGKALIDAGGAGTPPTALEVADAVWDEAASGHAGAGSTGKLLSDIKTETASLQADTDNIQTRLPAALVAGRMDASVGAMAADVITSAAIATDAIGSAQLSAAGVAEVAAAIKALVVETAGNYTLGQVLSIALAVLAGRTSSSGGTFSTPDGSVTRVAATIDGSSNRTAMTLTPSA
jgi:hypothetical protein